MVSYPPFSPRSAVDRRGGMNKEHDYDSPYARRNTASQSAMLGVDASGISARRRLWRILQVQGDKRYPVLGQRRCMVFGLRRAIRTRADDRRRLRVAHRHGTCSINAARRDERRQCEANVVGRRQGGGQRCGAVREGGWLFRHIRLRRRRHEMGLRDRRERERPAGERGRGGRYVRRAARRAQCWHVRHRLEPPREHSHQDAVCRRCGRFNGNCRGGRRDGVRQFLGGDRPNRIWRQGRGAAGGVCGRRIQRLQRRQQGAEARLSRHGRRGRRHVPCEGRQGRKGVRAHRPCRWRHRKDEGVRPGHERPHAHDIRRRGRHGDVRRGVVLRSGGIAHRRHGHRHGDDDRLGKRDQQREGGVQPQQRQRLCGRRNERELRGGAAFPEGRHNLPDVQNHGVPHRQRNVARHGSRLGTRPVLDHVERLYAWTLLRQRLRDRRRRGDRPHARLHLPERFQPRGHEQRIRRDERMVRHKQGERHLPVRKLFKDEFRRVHDAWRQQGR